MGVFYDICFGSVSLVAADIIKCQATRLNQHMCLLLAAEWKSILTVKGVQLK